MSTTKSREPAGGKTEAPVERGQPGVNRDGQRPANPRWSRLSTAQEMPWARAEDSGAREARTASAHTVASRGQGRALPEPVRAYFEPRFDHDLSEVRIHDEAPSAFAARAFQARAFTMGRDIYFGAGQYAPQTVPGRRLLAHELTHVVQQEIHGATGPAAFSTPRDAPEREADAVARRLERGLSAGPITARPTARVHRDPRDVPASVTEPDLLA